MTCIQKTINSTLPAHQEVLKDMLEPMKEKFNKYSELAKELTAIGLILDPCYKMRYLRYNLEQQNLAAASIDNFVGKVRAAILLLWNIYVQPPSAAPTSATPNPSAAKKVNKDLSGFHQYMAGTMGGIPANAPGAKLDLYLEEQNLILKSNNNNFNILGWWQANASCFPSLSELARIILMIPMTLVASESAFSTGGRVLDNHWMRLGEETVEALLCAQDWIRGKKEASA